MAFLSFLVGHLSGYAACTWASVAVIDGPAAEGKEVVTACEHRMRGNVVAVFGKGTDLFHVHRLEKGISCRWALSHLHKWRDDMTLLKPISVLVLCATSLALSACFPVYKTLQPYSEAKVLDEHGKPIDLAEIALISSAYPYGNEQFRTVARTNPSGTASFYKVKDFRIESLMMHGAQSFFWNWCVKSKGYETVTTSFRNTDQFDPHAQFKLKPGVSTACPEPEY
ncbi:hypothetical protein D9M70_413350 [compost metagenome]